MAPDSPSDDRKPTRQFVRIGVVGAGTMGAGIAQVAAQSGAQVVLNDVQQAFVERGLNTIRNSLERLVSRGKVEDAERVAILGRFQPTTNLEDLGSCDIVIEAAPEDPGIKLGIFRRLDEVCGPETILASNTSSLSITEIGRNSGRPDRVAGMHFFNPPAVLKLVEVVRGAATSDATVQAALDLARTLGKTPVLCRDTPGFVVNRVARPFYLEALCLLGEGVADVEAIDGALRSVGFPMGPFQLMDLIGIDINFAVTKSVFEQRFYEPRFRPHLLQQTLVRAGHLGRKTGLGFYDYAADPPTVAVNPPSESGPTPPIPAGWSAIAQGKAAVVVSRVLSSLVNEAHFALGEGVASAEDLDQAMKLGTNYPRGLIAWGDELGLPLVLETLTALEDWYRDSRHAPAPLLRERAASL